VANNFQITISAVDRATNVVRRINNEFSRGFRPLVNLYRSARRLGAEISRNPIANVLIRVARVAGNVAVGFTKIAAPLAALIGVGTIASIVTLATEWGRVGFEITKTALGMGMAATDLQSLRGAAELAGVSADVLTNSLKSVGDTMQDALGGRNQTALVMLNKIGVSIHKTADGSIDVVRGFKDIATYIANIKSAQVQGLVARQFGLEGALPLLRKGAAGIEEYQRKIAEFGGTSTAAGIAAAEQFGLSLNYLMASAGGLKIAIGAAIMPALQPMVAEFTKFINLNREPIGQQIGVWAKQVGDWIKETDFSKAAASAMEFGRAVVYIVDSVAKLIATLSKLQMSPMKYVFGGFPRMVFDAVTGNPDQTGQAPSKAASPSQRGVILPLASAAATPAAAPAASAQQRSGTPVGIRNNNPGNLRSWGSVPQRGGFAAFETPEAGLAAMIRNLQTQQSKHGLNTIQGIVSKWAPSSENDTDGYVKSVEKQTGFGRNQKLDLNDKKTVAPLVSAIIKQEGNSAGYSKSMVEDAVTKVVVEFKNAPSGTSAASSVKGGAMTPVRISYAMPTLAAG
jgi:hypothetical protein